MKLFDGGRAPNPRRVRIFLAEKGIDVPLVGDEVRAPFEGAGDAADQLADAGTAQVEAVTELAFWLGLSVGAIPVLIALAVVAWLAKAQLGAADVMGLAGEEVGLDHPPVEGG